MSWYYWLVIAICSVFSYFFSSADMVYSVVNRDKLASAAEKGSKKAKLALHIAENYEASIASILFGNSLVNIIASSLITIIGMRWNEDWGSTVAALLFTIFIIIFGRGISSTSCLTTII